MENVTITLDDDLARRARKAAEACGKSLADFVRDVLVERLEQEKRIANARSFLDLPPLDLTDEKGRLPSREEMYAERTDQLFHRHEHLDLSTRRESAEEAGGRKLVDTRLGGG